MRSDGSRAGTAGRKGIRADGVYAANGGGGSCAGDPGCGLLVRTQARMDSRCGGEAIGAQAAGNRAVAPRNEPYSAPRARGRADACGCLFARWMRTSRPREGGQRGERPGRSPVNFLAMAASPAVDPFSLLG